MYLFGMRIFLGWSFLRNGRHGEFFFLPLPSLQASLVAQRLKCLPAMWETWVQSLGREIPRRRKWQPTPVFLPGESHGQRSLVGYSPWGRKESDMTERLHFHFSQFSRLVVSYSLWSHGLQQARPPCPSPTPGVYPNLCPLSRWCHPTISSSVVPFFSCLQSFQHQSLYKWVSSSHQVAKVLEFHLQHQSFQCTLRTDLL